MNRDTTLPRENTEWKRTLALAFWSGLTMIAVVLAARKLAGAFENPLSEVVACGLAFLSSAISVIAFLLATDAMDRRSLTSTQRVFVGFLTLVPPTAIGIVLLPTTVAGSTCLLTLFALSSAVVFVPNTISLKTAVFGDRTIGLSEYDKNSPTATIDAIGDPFVETPRVAELQLSTQSDTTQWMSRTVSESGEDILEGSIRVEFRAGQKQANAHIPFSPPFACVPEIECEMADETTVRVRIAAAHTFGGRLELRRSMNADLADSVEVSFAAVAKAPANSDAA